MKWSIFGVGCAIIVAGVYGMKLGDVKTGATLIGVGALLVDPSVVIDGIKAWRGNVAG